MKYNLRLFDNSTIENKKECLKLNQERVEHEIDELSKEHTNIKESL